MRSGYKFALKDCANYAIGMDIGRARIIADVICKYTGFSWEELIRNRRDEPRHVSRWLLCYCLREILKGSWSSMGRFLNRDHGTVMHGYQQFSKILTVDDALRMETEQVLQLCRDALSADAVNDTNANNGRHTVLTI